MEFFIEHISFDSANHNNSPVLSQSAMQEVIDDWLHRTIIAHDLDALEQFIEAQANLPIASLHFSVKDDCNVTLH